ncbi:MAG: maleylacetoacetate isomerase [Legionella sp.]|nr:maleylacetoacetate isomerase [Legionella sp.]
MKLYDYFRSTACYRVRIALNHKQLPYESVEIHLVNQGGQQHSPEYLQINPQGLVPSLECQGNVLTQSLAILEYLDETFPLKPLLPKDTTLRAKIRAQALLILCDIHPLNNLRVLNRLKMQFEAGEEDIMDWYHHWLKLGFDAFESQLHTFKRTAPVCSGSEIGLADVCLIPQVYNAKRFDFSLKPYPLIQEINTYCLEQEAFKAASPTK